MLPIRYGKIGYVLGLAHNSANPDTTLMYQVKRSRTLKQFLQGYAPTLRSV